MAILAGPEVYPEWMAHYTSGLSRTPEGG
jgi:hypothetical protein